MPEVKSKTQANDADRSGLFNYYFPEHNRTVRAKSMDEAIAKLNDDKEDSDTAAREDKVQ